MKYFISGLTARTAADLAGIHRNTAVRFFHKLRCSIAVKQQERAAQFAGEIELDESYFGGHRKGMRGRGATGKVAVFGILKRGGQVYTQIILDAKVDTLMPIIRQKIVPDSIVIQIVGENITRLMFQNLNISALIIRSYLRMNRTILMALKIFGTKPNDI